MTRCRPKRASQGWGVSGIGRVIVGVSGSPGSITALRYAEFFSHGGDVIVLAVHAWVPPGGDLAERRSPSPELCRLCEEAARQRLRDAIFAAWGTGLPEVDARAIVQRGEAGPVLAGLACSAGDLLVVGAGRRGRLARVWGGKVTRYCLAHARCPVLAVPPPALAREAGRGLRGFAYRHRELTLERALREWEREALDHRGR